MDKNQSYPDGSPANRFSSWIRQLVWMQKCKIRVHRKLYRAEGAPSGCVKRPSQLSVGVKIVPLPRQFLTPGRGFSYRSFGNRELHAARQACRPELLESKVLPASIGRYSLLGRRNRLPGSRLLTPGYRGHRGGAGQRCSARRRSVLTPSLIA